MTTSSYEQFRNDLLIAVAKFIDSSRKLATIVEAVANAGQDAMRSLSQAWVDIFYSYHAAENLYLKHHRRLPGSNRTKRLRKKRINTVVQWYVKYLDAE